MLSNGVIWYKNDNCLSDQKLRDSFNILKREGTLQHIFKSIPPINDNVLCGDVAVDSIHIDFDTGIISEFLPF